MANIEVTNVDTGSVVLRNIESADDLLTLAMDQVILEGTILARDSVSGFLVPFVKGGATNENGIPKAVITYELTATAAGEYPVRILQKGTVRTQRLVIEADGDASNVDNVVRDELRNYSIIATDVTELNELDNQ